MSTISGRSAGNSPRTTSAPLPAAGAVAAAAKAESPSKTISGKPNTTIESCTKEYAASSVYGGPYDDPAMRYARSTAAIAPLPKYAGMSHLPLRRDDVDLSNLAPPASSPADSA